jgi:C-terminal processing protease CtpA/Prc
MKRVYFLFFITFVFFTSCKKDVSPVTSTDLLNQQARDVLDSLMNDWYYWYKNLPVVNLSDYKDPYELMDALRYKQLDRWSFVADYEAFVASMQGSFVGHGIRLGLDPSGNVRIVQIYNNSPMYSLGVRRGWIVKQLNGTDLAPIFISADAAAYNQLIGPATAGRSNTFLFQIPDGKDTTITTPKANFTVNSVILNDTLHLKSGITGHLVFDEFIEPSSLELQEAFNYLTQNNVTDLILDLRYNSGGILDVATDLASYIAGTARFSTPFFKMDYNDKKSSYNSVTNFNTISYPLSLSRIVIICTRETASASETVINGLKPFLDVKLVGDTTNGKPTGMNVWSYADKFIFAPITFKLVNSADQGDFFAGLPPDKYVPDDITHDFSDRNESCLKEAISFLETGSFSTKGGYIFKRYVQYSEKPELMNNAYKVERQKINK